MPSAAVPEARRSEAQGPAAQADRARLLPTAQQAGQLNLHPQSQHRHASSGDLDVIAQARHGLAAVQSSREVSADLPAPAQQYPPGLGVPAAAHMTQQPVRPHPHDSERPDAVPGDDPVSMMLCVEEDKQPAMTALAGSAARERASPQLRQNCADRAPRWVLPHPTAAGGSPRPNQGFIRSRRGQVGQDSSDSLANSSCQQC